MITLIAFLLYTVVAAIAVLSGKRFPHDDCCANTISVKLSPRFSLNPKEHLLLDGLLLLNEHIDDDNESWHYYDYDDEIWHCYFSKEGDVYIKRTLLGRSVFWVHFAPNGKKVKLLKSNEISDLLYCRKIGAPVHYLVDAEHGHDLTVFLKS